MVRGRWVHPRLRSVGRVTGSNLLQGPLALFSLGAHRPTLIGGQVLVSRRLLVCQAYQSTSSRSTTTGSTTTGSGGGGGGGGGGGAEPSMAADLWASPDAGEWQAQLDEYAGVVERKGKDGLVELDR